MGVEEKNDHTLYIQDGLTDVEKMKNTFRKLVNNRQKISHNIVTNSMVYVAQLGGKDVLVVEVPHAERRFGEILSAFHFIESLFYSRQVEQTERQRC